MNFLNSISKQAHEGRKSQTDPSRCPQNPTIIQPVSLNKSVHIISTTFFITILELFNDVIDFFNNRRSLHKKFIHQVLPSNKKNTQTS